MKLSIISFTEKGMQLSERIAKILKKDPPKMQAASEQNVFLYTKCKACMENGAYMPALFVKDSLTEWAKGQMQEKNALLFIGACGIAVRAIAPSLTDKLHDSPVLVMDEQGRHVIPILSGHMGGANELAKYLAKKIDADPVITTATDLNQAFAVDLFAKKNGLLIENKDGIVKVSSRILAGIGITMSIEPGHLPTAKEAGNGDWDSPRLEGGYMRGGVRLVSYPPAGNVDVVVTSENKAYDAAIVLKPKEYVIGMGCKRGKSFAEIDAFIHKKTEELGILTGQVFALCSISQKKDEQGLVEWCQKKRVSFLTYTAEELQEVNGDFNESAFVKGQVGVGNVCERAALKACENGHLMIPKQAENGMTLAIAKREWKVCLW